MKTKYPRMFGILIAVMLVASFVVPTSFVSPSAVQADPGICKWDTLREPGSIHGSWVVGFGNGRRTEIIDMDVASDGTTIAAIVRVGNTNIAGADARDIYTYLNPGYGSVTGGGLNILLVSQAMSGLFWTSSKYNALVRETNFTAVVPPVAGVSITRNLFQVAFAPDNPNFIAVTSDNRTLGTGPVEMWITQNGGSDWEITNLATQLHAGETIRSISISVDYGGKRDIAVATTTGAGGGRILVAKSTGFAGWQDQNVSNASTAPVAAVNLGTVDFFAIKFSPSYPSDAALTAVYSDNVNTYYNIALRDLDNNTTLAWVNIAPGLEVAPSGMTGVSPSFTTLNRAEIELPSDFSGQAASLRRAYVSTDTYNGGAAKTGAWDGIVRFDNTTIYVLMDTSGQLDKSIYSIAYFGTYASGKLLAGDRIGYTCSATVPTYFTDSPTTCPIPCWYDALKPTTGAACGAGGGTCVATSKNGIGAAIVAWRANGQLAFAATGSLATGTGATWWNAFLQQPTPNDESAFAISRNNGETWNQISLIDTTITQFTDIAPSADCKTIYLASVNTTDNAEAPNCCGFDSVWRTSSNIDVTSPLTPLPVGTYYERVLTHVTSLNCANVQTNLALLRLVPYCADPTGEVVGWAAWNTTAAAWSPDFGDYWATITVRNPVQDFAFESRTMLYFLSPIGLVQKMPYTGTAWSSALATIDSGVSTAHTIAAYPEGKILVGGGGTFTAAYACAYSSNMNTDNPSISVQFLAGSTGSMGGVHVAFDPAFDDNSIYYIAQEGAGGSVYRNNPTATLRWADTDMMSLSNGAFGCPANPGREGMTGLVLAFTGEALYASSGAGDGSFGVWRTIDDGTGKFGPLSGMPKPGIAWDRLFVGLGTGVDFTLQPSALKACGCCTLETDTSLYAIDNNLYRAPIERDNTALAALGHYFTQPWGLIWGFTDCLAKRGPSLITEDKMLIGCDPVTGRAQEVNLCWEQLCVADCYDVEISKNTDFSIRVLDWVSESSCNCLEPVDVTIPCAYIPAGGSFATNAESDRSAMGSAVAFYGQLECGHTYYWRVKARWCATQQVIRSPWSEVRQFTVKAGLPVTTPYYGPQLLAPNNGCLGCPVQPVSFSWSPFKETMKYKFVLAKDAAMTQIVKEAEVATTAFEYDGALDYSTNYFWRIMSMEPAPSDWSATFSFQTESAPPPPIGKDEAPPTPFWVWVVIAIGAILVIVTLVLIFKTRRV